MASRGAVGPLERLPVLALGHDRVDGLEGLEHAGVVGEHAILVAGDEKHVVGVVFIKGHPVVKSVVRMVRQLMRLPASAIPAL